MKLHTFTLPKKITEDKTEIELPQDQAKHAAVVLRLKEGEQIKILDITGQTALATILSTKNKKVIIKLTKIWEKTAAKISENGQNHLALAIIKPSLFELVVQKAVELGAASLRPIISQRTNPHYKLNYPRLIKIAQEAQKQCLRESPLKIHQAHNLEDYLMSTKKHQGLKALFSLAKHSENKWPEIKSNENTHLLIGPEGGFSLEEEQTIYQYNFKALNFGSLILKSETAAIASLAIFNQLREKSIAAKQLFARS